jgi:CheY-like chemotaxis protein
MYGGYVTMEKIKFVMTDTDTQVSAVCRRALEAKGIAVTVCEKNGTKALETLLAVHPQAVLLDAFMPDLDAITVKQRYEAMLEQDPDNARFKMLLDNWVAAKDHPTKEDMDNMAAAAKKAVLGE